MMEAPFRFPIQNLGDLEKLLAALNGSSDLVLGSLHLTEGYDLLVEQFQAEGRRKPSQSTVTLFRALWRKPLQAQRPRFLRLEAQLRKPPPHAISLRIDMPILDRFPRWVDAEGSRDTQALAHLLDIYQRLSQASQLPLIAV